jgi:hypothetical protein
MKRAVEAFFPCLLARHTSGLMHLNIRGTISESFAHRMVSQWAVSIANFSHYLAISPGPITRAVVKQSAQRDDKRCWFEVILWSRVCRVLDPLGLLIM